MEQREVPAVDGAVARERLEIDHLVPVLRAEQNDRQALGHLARLHQRHDLEQLIERAETARSVKRQDIKSLVPNAGEFCLQFVIEMIVPLFVLDRDVERNHFDPLPDGEVAHD